MNRHFKVLSIVAVLGLVGLSFHATLKDENALKFIASVVSNLSHVEFYESLANPTVRYIKVPEGMRKEEIAMAFDDKFKWNQSDVSDFLGHDEFRDTKFEGKYFPDVYLVPKNSSGADMKQIMNKRFQTKYEELKNSVSTSTSNIPTNTVLTVASIIQREAAGKSDMNLISGIIWNRINKKMPLQMDATLQYVKGNENNGWWPNVLSKDKHIDSPYNTYQNKGLPPSPIANPGLAAIEAALNPLKTKYLYYFHKDRKIYTSETYVDHKKKIDLYLK